MICEHGKTASKCGECMPVGPTGTFPQGKLGPNDEGGINIGVEVRDGRVLIHFGKQISWLGLGPAEAKTIGEMLLQKAWEIEHVRTVDLG